MTVIASMMTRQALAQKSAALTHNVDMTSWGGGDYTTHIRHISGPMPNHYLCELPQDEFDLGSDWPRTGASGTTPAGKSASSSSGRAGTGGSSKQASSSHQPGQTRDAQTNAFRTAGNAAATGAPLILVDFN